MDPFCPRTISFVIPAKFGGGVRVTAVENAGNIDFTVDVLGTDHDAADLRGLFFHFDEADLAGLQILGGGGLITGQQIAANSVINLGQGVNMNGHASRSMSASPSGRRARARTSSPVRCSSRWMQ